MAEKMWRTYEQVAQDLLNRFGSELGLARVEGKQNIRGHRSDTTWEIDAKGICEGSEKFWIVECRRRTKSRLNQESVAGLAYRIRDTGATGGIIVTPFDLQKGAKKIAQSENIKTVTLDEGSNTEEYVMSFLNKIFVGLHDTMTISDSAIATLYDKNGNEITKR